MADFSNTPLVELALLADTAEQNGDQELLNAIVIEYTKRWYHPVCGKTKEEFMAEFGYKEIKTENKPKIFSKKKKKRGI